MSRYVSTVAPGITMIIADAAPASGRRRDDVGASERRLSAGPELPGAERTPNVSATKPPPRSSVGCVPSPQARAKTNGRHRPDRGANRQANAALYRAVIVRMRWHEPTIA